MPRDYGGGSVGVAVYDDRPEVTSSGSLHFGLTKVRYLASGWLLAASAPVTEVGLTLLASTGTGPTVG